jgi:hypothetical protein
MLPSTSNFTLDPQVYTGRRGFALQTMVLLDDLENQMAKVEALGEML